MTVRIKYTRHANVGIYTGEPILTKEGLAFFILDKNGQWNVTTDVNHYNGYTTSVAGAKAAVRRKLMALGADLGQEVKRRRKK